MLNGYRLEPSIRALLTDEETLVLIWYVKEFKFYSQKTVTLFYGNLKLPIIIILKVLNRKLVTENCKNDILLLTTKRQAGKNGTVKLRYKKMEN